MKNTVLVILALVCCGCLTWGCSGGDDGSKETAQYQTKEKPAGLRMGLLKGDGSPAAKGGGAAGQGKAAPTASNE